MPSALAVRPARPYYGSSQQAFSPWPWALGGALEYEVGGVCLHAWSVKLLRRTESTSLMTRTHSELL